MYSVDHFESIRLHELQSVLSLFPAAARVLELGAGSGWQARELAQRGWPVEAIDVAGSTYERDRVFPVVEYDGRTIPFPDDSFDVVFSSNVLEHVEELDRLQADIARVLRPGGICIHILPTASWRFWTNVLHVPFVVQLALRRVFRATPSGPLERTVIERMESMPLTAKIRRLFVPAAHGATGNALTELYYFSSRRWLRCFSESGWIVERDFATQLFYSGYGLLDSGLGIERRRLLSRILGSSCRVFILRRANASSPPELQ
jgi:SAM-dependent methyltransferase